MYATERLFDVVSILLYCLFELVDKFRNIYIYIYIYIFKLKPEFSIFHISFIYQIPEKKNIYI